MPQLLLPDFMDNNGRYVTVTVLAHLIMLCASIFRFVSWIIVIIHEILAACPTAPRRLTVSRVRDRSARVRKLISAVRSRLFDDAAGPGGFGGHDANPPYLRLGGATFCTACTSKVSCGG